MDEQEWLASSNPLLLYAHARRVAVPVLKSGRRRLRFYACACCRQVWHLLGDAGRAAVVAAELYADDRATAAHLRNAHLAAEKEYLDLGKGLTIVDLRSDPEGPTQALRRTAARMAGAKAAYRASAASITAGALSAAAECRVTQHYVADRPQAAFADHGQLQCDLLRDIFGNPFRPVQADPAWLRWNDGAVPKVARAIYDERAFERLSVLADALEDAGCGDETILAHLRGPGPHVRGCWALDLLRGD